jgi:hypothetical protein
VKRARLRLRFLSFFISVLPATTFKMVPFYRVGRTAREGFAKIR